LKSGSMLRVVTVIATLFASVHAVAADKKATVANRMVYGETGRLDGFDPYTVHEASGQRLADLLFDSLVDVGPGGEYLPGLAKSWTIGGGGTKVTFTLRNDVLWHAPLNKDGEPGGEKRYLGPADVVATVRVLMAKDSEIPNKERFAVLMGAESAGENEVTINLRRAMVDPLRVMMFKILPAHILAPSNVLKRDSAIAKFPVGSGPYQFRQANPQGELLMRSHDSYFGGKPKIGNVVMKSYADQNIMAQSLMYGSLDLVTYVSPRDLGEIMGDSKLSLVPYDALSFSFFALNTARGPLKDKRVRQAVSYAVNRQEMLQAFFQGKGKLVSGPFPPTSWAYNMDVKPMGFDVGRAKSLLKTAGFEDKNGDGFLEGLDGKPVTLVFGVPLAGESEMIKRIVLAFQGYLSKVGFKVELKFWDWLVWKKKVLQDHDYDITIAAWSFDDAANIMSLFHSSSAVAWGNNFVQYSNPEVDSLLSEADATNLWTLTHHAAHSNKLTGVRVEPFAFFKHITSWQMEGATHGRK
jgi:peptide/nickel transport system substrate-binding protein